MFQHLFFLDEDGMGDWAFALRIFLGDFWLQPRCDLHPGFLSANSGTASSESIMTVISVWNFAETHAFHMEDREQD